MAEGQVEQSNGPAPGGNPSDATGMDAAIMAELAAMEAQTQEPENEPSEEDDSEPDKLEADDQADDEGKVEEEAPDSTAGPTAEIEFDGETYQVPEKLKDAFMMKADYTRKTMEVAEHARAIEQRDQQSQQIFQASEQFIAGRAALQVLDGQYSEIMGYLQANPNMQAENPLEFGNIGTRLQLLNQQRAGLANHLQQTERQQAQYSAQVKQQRISAALPWLEKQGIDANTQKAVAEYAIKSGMFTQNELAYINDGENPALMLLIDKARKFDALQETKTKVVEQVRAAKPVRVIRPGSSSQGTQTASTEQLGRRLASSGSMKDAERLELAHLAKRERQQRR